MTYLKLNTTQLNTLKNLPNNLNDSLVYNNIGGIICFNKANEIKHIIFDFEAYNMDEFFMSSKDNKIHLLKHIKNPNPKKYYTLSFEIENILKKSSLQTEFNSFSCPDVFQWIKCSIFSIYRNIYNHLVFTHSNNIYLISMKKTYFYTLYRKKHTEKIPIKNMYHILMKEYIDIFHYHKIKNKSTFVIPDKFNEYFNIQQFDLKKNVLFQYYSHNPTNIIARI